MRFVSVRTVMYKYELVIEAVHSTLDIVNRCLRAFLLVVERNDKRELRHDLDHEMLSCPY